MERSAFTSGVDYGHQGGDPARRVVIDLSTCVNRYGPAPASIEAMRCLVPSDILMHPYEAPSRLRELFAWETGRPADEFVAGRGTSEFIWAIGRNVDQSRVAIPVPSYTDYLKAFPGRAFSLRGEQIPSLEQLDAALEVASIVLISNPHNPTGTFFRPDEILPIVARHGDATLVLDESYIDFTPNPMTDSCLGSEVPNLVVLRSTSKFYGIAATRAGIAWSRDRTRLATLIGPQETWGLSGVDVHIADAAVRSTAWASATRLLMHNDNRWLAEAMRRIPTVEIKANENVHFQYGLSRHADTLATAFAAHGVGVRSLGAAHGVMPGGLRVVAPRIDERSVVAEAIEAVAELATRLGS